MSRSLPTDLSERVVIDITLRAGGQLTIPTRCRAEAHDAEADAAGLSIYAEIPAEIMMQVARVALVRFRDKVWTCVKLATGGDKGAATTTILGNGAAAARVPKKHRHPSDRYAPSIGMVLVEVV